MTEQSQSLDSVKQELAEKSQKIDELAQSNAQLSHQYESICKQLEEALEMNENQKQEKIAWEMALKKASNAQKQSDVRKQRERQDLQMTIETKDAQIAEL